MRLLLSSTFRRLRLNLSGELLDAEYDEFAGFERRESHHDVHDTEIDVVLCRGRPVAGYEVGVARRASLTGSLPEDALPESADIQPHLSPPPQSIPLQY